MLSPIALHRLGVVTYYGFIASKGFRGPASIALQALGAMVNTTSGPLRKAAVRALVGMRLRKKSRAIKTEYEADSSCGPSNDSSTTASEAASFGDDCGSSERCKQALQESGTHFWGWEKEKVLLCFAAAILLLGHWQRILWALSTLSLSQLSTVAAVACVAAAAYIHVAAHLKGWTMRVQEAWDQLACLVMSVISAILQLPECSKNIKLALGSLQEVDYTLKNIHAKIRFLPGTWERKVALSSCTEGVSSF